MTERKRLIELINKCDTMSIPTDGFIEGFADYLLENGIKVPPCKIGDTVYKVLGKCEPRFEDCAFNGGYGTPRCNGFKCNAYIEEIKFTLPLVDYIGERVFLTREEAEKALVKQQADV